MRMIYLDLDSLRPDHLSGYGYHRPTSPNLDRIIRDGMRFTHAYCQTSPCVPSRAALFSGRYDVHSGVVTHWGPGSHLRGSEANSGRGNLSAPPMFIRHLFANGYRPISFSSFADRHNAWWFCTGWSEFHTTGLKRGNERADEVNSYVLPWLREHAHEDNFFLHLQYWDPHRVYRMPLEWLDRVKDYPPPDWPDAAAIEQHQASYGPFTASELYPGGDGPPPHAPSMPRQIASVADWKQLIDGYDASIAFMDDQIGQVLATLEQAGVLDETAFIISADHAEGQGEFAVYGDHCNASESVHNIPLVIRWPGVTRPNSVCDDFVYNVDLPPTLCDLLDIESPAGWDGRSFAPQLRSAQGSPRDYLVWSHGLYACQRVVRTPRWALMRTYNPGLFPYEPLALFDMANDPHQTRDVQAEHPEVVRELDHLMNGWLQEQLGYQGAAVDPLQLVVETGPFKYVQLDNWLDRLERRGRTGDADAIRQRLRLISKG